MSEKQETKYLFELLSPEVVATIRDVVRDTNFETIQELSRNIDPGNKFVNQTTLKSMLGIGQQVLDDMLASGLPCYKVGRQLLFRLEDVEEIIVSKYKI